MSIPWPYEDGWSPLEWPIDDRLKWEKELWIYSDKLEQWIEAPRMKVFELGKVGIQVLLRVGCRREWAWDDLIGRRVVLRDELYVGDTPEEVAVNACAGMTLPKSVLVCGYPHASYAMPPDRWLVTVHDDRILRTPVKAPDDEQRATDPHFFRPVCDGATIVTMREIEPFS